MEIYFDFELDEKLPQPSTTKQYIIADGLREFVRSKYGVLEEQIDSRQTENAVAFAVLYAPREGLQIKFGNIPDDLLPKIQTCLSLQDIELITDILYNDLKKNGDFIQDNQ
jgi:hypothetical protein